MKPLALPREFLWKPAAEGEVLGGCPASRTPGWEDWGLEKRDILGSQSYLSWVYTVMFGVNDRQNCIYRLIQLIFWIYHYIIKFI